jgi:hypothetical protein
MVPHRRTNTPDAVALMPSFFDVPHQCLEPEEKGIVGTLGGSALWLHLLELSGRRLEQALVKEVSHRGGIRYTGGPQIAFEQATKDLGPLLKVLGDTQTRLAVVHLGGRVGTHEGSLGFR